ncbi:MAG TPA: metallopeptidase family protein [Chloroflexota bacterium]
MRTTALTLNRRLERLARYRTARKRVAPLTSMKAFEALVAEVLDDLPPYVQQRLENVAVVVDEGADSNLLGLYEGVNRVERASGYHLATPDRITLFWKPIVDQAGSSDPEAIRQEVRKTIIHEIAHHFGIDDAELERLGG